MSAATTVYTLLTLLLGLVAIGSIFYLLTLLLAALSARRMMRRAETGGGDPTLPQPRLAVVIPAHNEEMVLAATLESLRAQDYPAARYEVVVIADNCTDATAQIARDYGVTVLERANLNERGKGYALAWAMSRLLASSSPADAFIIVDADTWVAPDFLRLMAARLETCRDRNGCAALQGRYGVLNAQDSWRSALMAGAFELTNHVRPLGYDRLGLTVTLKGNGMAFSREVMELVPWQGHSITEDLDYGLDLLRHGNIRVRYVPEARVLAQMPVTATQAASQRERWEGGRYRVLRERALPLLGEGIRRRSVPLCDAAVALIIPPLAELAALIVLWAVLIALGARLHLLLDAGRFGVACALTFLGFLTYVLGGLHAADAPRGVYLALLKAPVYAIWKFGLYLGRLPRRLNANRTEQPEWVRTERIATPPSNGSEPTGAPNQADRAR